MRLNTSPTSAIVFPSSLPISPHHCNRPQDVTHDITTQAEAERDVNDIVKAYANLDTQSRGVLTRDQVMGLLSKSGVANNIAVATIKMLDMKNTGTFLPSNCHTFVHHFHLCFLPLLRPISLTAGIVGLGRFIQGWRLGCLPMNPDDGERCCNVMHRLVTAIIKMGARKAKGQPYTLQELFAEYFTTTYGMDPAVSASLTCSPYHALSCLSTLMSLTRTSTLPWYAGDRRDRGYAGSGRQDRVPAVS